MHIGESFKRSDVKDAIEKASRKTGDAPQYGISDGGHNLVGGFKDAGISHHLDISHTLGNCMKHVYEKDAEFMALTEKLGKIRLQYHLTDKAWFLPPNMRAMARFMNLREWVVWARKMLEFITPTTYLQSIVKEHIRLKESRFTKIYTRGMDQTLQSVLDFATLKNCLSQFLIH